MSDFKYDNDQSDHQDEIDEFLDNEKKSSSAAHGPENQAVEFNFT